MATILQCLAVKSRNGEVRASTVLYSLAPLCLAASLEEQRLDRWKGQSPGLRLAGPMMGRRVSTSSNRAAVAGWAQGGRQAPPASQDAALGYFRCAAMAMPAAA